MSLTLTQSISAIVPGNSASFLAVGGTGPYLYSVIPGGAGGTINSSTGVYTGPAQMGDISDNHAERMYDTILVTDSLSATASLQILVGTPLFLVCDIIQTQMGLPNDHCYVWDQKIFMPTDSNLYVIISLPRCKPFGNNIVTDPSDGSIVSQQVNMQGTLDIQAISRGPSARDKKELIILALNSVYSQQQQQANGFYIAKLPVSFLDISSVDGGAIPYRYKISMNIQYVVSNSNAVPYFDSFQTPTISLNP